MTQEDDLPVLPVHPNMEKPPCPKCKADSTMVLVTARDPETDAPTGFQCGMCGEAWE